MSSLKGYIPALARIVGMTPDAIYERQRALVRAGLLETDLGRGPGSGVRATAPSMALLLISILGADRLAESEARVRALMCARPTPGRKIAGAMRCPFSGMTTFCDALAAILVATGKANAVTKITVSRTADRAQIQYYDAADRHNLNVVEFIGNAPNERGVSVSAILDHSSLQQIAADIQAMVHESFNSLGGANE